MPFTDNVPHFEDNDEVKDSAEVKGGLAEDCDTATGQPPAQAVQAPSIAQITLVDHGGTLEVYPVVYGVVTDEGTLDPVGFIPESDAHREVAVLEGILKSRLNVNSRILTAGQVKPVLEANTIKFNKARELARRIRASDIPKFGAGSPENGYKPQPRKYK